MTLPDELDLLLVEHDPLEAELLFRALAELTERERIGVARDGEEALDWIETAEHDIIVPHPRFHERRFALEPVAELDPQLLPWRNWQKTLAALAAAFALAAGLVFALAR